MACMVIFPLTGVKAGGAGSGSRLDSLVHQVGLPWIEMAFVWEAAGERIKPNLTLSY